VLAGLFGNRTVERILIFLAMNQEAYAQELSKQLGTPLSMIQAQLKRLERGGIIVSRPRGRMRFFRFNPRFPFTDSLVDILRRAFEFLPAGDREPFIVRRRPRATGKPL